MDNEKELHQTVVEQLMSSSKPLVEKCQADVGTVDNDVNELRERWDNVCNAVQEAEKTFPKMKEAVVVYEQSVVPLEKCVEQAEDVLVNVEPFGLDTNKADEQLNKLKVCLVNVSDKSKLEVSN